MRNSLLTAIASIAAVAIASSAQAGVNLVTNGGFETGDLTGWTVTGPTGALQSCQTNWTVATSGGTVGCEGHNPGNPVAGSNAVYTSNDGGGPLTYSLAQLISVPVGATSGTLSFDWTADSVDSNRQFNVLLDGQTVFSSTSSTNDTWTLETIDVSAILASVAGTSVSLQFNNYIPASFTGCCNGLGLDQVSLTTEASVPEPASIALLGLGLLGLGQIRRRHTS